MLLVLPHLSFAYSGAGAECGDPELEFSAISGTPNDLEKTIDAQIDRWIQYENKQKRDRSLLTKLFSGESQALAPVSRNALRSGFVKSWSGCDGVLLDYVAAAGNLENTEYLLRLGVDPSGRRLASDEFLRDIGIAKNDPGFMAARQVSGDETIFMRCRSLRSDRKGITQFFNRNRSIEDMQKQFAVYSLLLSKGGDLEAKRKNGRQAVHGCKDPDIIDWYVLRGVKLTPGDSVFHPFTPLQRAVLNAIANPSPEHMEQLKGIGSGSNNIDTEIESKRVERLIRTVCGRKGNKNVCSEASKLINTSTGAFEGR